MNLRHLLVAGGISLILFLAMYTWNRRTEVLDDLAANVGLELTSCILRPLRGVQNVVGDFWDRYFDLVGVREENLRLKARLDDLEARLMATGEDMAELARLRALVRFPVDARWRPLAARVLAGRLGPNAVLDSITISRGYATGARPGIPLVTNLGLVGRVLRSSAHASTVLLITDPGSHVAVFGQETRAPGILKGHGMGKELEVDFVQRDASLKDGEILVTSGLDNKYPKGLPVARVTNVTPSDYTQFMAVNARPLVDFQHLEEVLLLEKSGVELPPDEPDGPPPILVGPPVPPHLLKNRDMAVQHKHEEQPVAPADSTAGGAAVSSGNSAQASNQAQSDHSAPTNRSANTSVARNHPETATPAQSARERLAPARSLRGGQPGNVPRNSEGAPVYRVITP